MDKRSAWPFLSFLALCALCALSGWDRCDAAAPRRATARAVAAHREAAAELARDGDLDKAAAAIEAARALDPADPETQREAMRLEVRRAAERPAALDAAERGRLEYALEVVGRDLPISRVARARLALARGRRDEAAVQLEAAIQADPRYLQAHLALGALRREQGRLAEAVASFEAARALAPDHLAALNNLGVAYLDAQRAAEAQAVLEHALAVQDTAATRLNLANTQLALGRAPGAVLHLERAVALEPGSVEAWRRLAGALTQAGSLAQAAKALGRAIALRPDPAVAYELALTLQALERFKEAAGVLRQVVDADPDHLDAAYQLGATLQRLGDEKGAKGVLERYLERSAGDAQEAARRAQVLAALSEAAEKPPAPPAPAATPRPSAPGP